MAAIELNVTSIGRINSISDTSLNNTYAVVYNSSTGTPMGFEMDVIVDMDASLVAAHEDIASVELGLSNEVTARVYADTLLDEKIKNTSTGHDHDGVDSRVVDHDNLANKGTNTHAQIDAHIANTANPHSTTKAQVGLEHVDNTSDADKPISIAQGSALAVLFKAASYNENTGVLTFTKRDDSTVTVTIPAVATVNSKAPLASPALTGTPTTPTAAPGTNTTQIASTAFVAAAIAALVDSSPATLDTLAKLASALGDDPNFATTVTNLIGTKINISAIANDLITEAEGKVLDARQGKELDDKKVDKVTGKGLSANDYTTEEKAEVAKIATIESDVSSLELSNVEQKAAVRSIENTLNSLNINQEATTTSEGYETISLPKTAANGGMSVKMEGLTEDVGGVITHFDPTGRIRSVDADEENPTYLYLTAPVLRSNGAVKDEIRKGVNGYELVKRVGVGTLGSETYPLPLNFNVGYNYSVQATVVNDNTFSVYSTIGGINTNQILSIGKWYVLEVDFSTNAGLIINESNLQRTDRRELLSLPGNVIFKAQYPCIYFRQGVGTSQITKISLKEISAIDGEILDKQILTIYTNNTAHYTLATPVITQISHAGLLNSNSEGTVYHEPVIADAGVYSTNMAIQLTDYPIASIEEIIKWVDGVETLLDIEDAVIAEGGLSFTHPSLESGDLVLFTYNFEKESTEGKITLTYYDSRYVIADTTNGKFYRWKVTSTGGNPSIELEEV